MEETIAEIKRCMQEIEALLRRAGTEEDGEVQRRYLLKEALVVSRELRLLVETFFLHYEMQQLDNLSQSKFAQ